MSISFHKLWLLQSYDGGLSWLLITLANPLLLCRTERFMLWGTKTWENNNAKTLLSQSSACAKGISIPTRTTRHSETIQQSDPERLPPTVDVSFCCLDRVVLILVYCLQLWVYLHPTLCLSMHHFPVHPHSLFFLFLSTSHLLPLKLSSNSFRLVFSGSPLPPRHSPLGTTTAPINRMHALLCPGTAVVTLFMLQTLSIFSGSLEVEG